jgi:hypothetical protein
MTDLLLVLVPAVILFGLFILAVAFAKDMTR